MTRLFDLSLTDMCEAALARQDDIGRMAGFLQRMFDEGRLSRTSFSEAKADARKFTVFVQTLYRYAEALGEWESEKAVREAVHTCMRECLLRNSGIRGTDLYDFAYAFAAAMWDYLDRTTSTPEQEDPEAAGEEVKPEPEPDHDVRETTRLLLGYLDKNGGGLSARAAHLRSFVETAAAREAVDPPGQ